MKRMIWRAHSKVPHTGQLRWAWATYLRQFLLRHYLSFQEWFNKYFIGWDELPLLKKEGKFTWSNCELPKSYDGIIFKRISKLLHPSRILTNSCWPDRVSYEIQSVQGISSRFVLDESFNYSKKAVPPKDPVACVQKEHLICCSPSNIKGNTKIQSSSFELERGSDNKTFCTKIDRPRVASSVLMYKGLHLWRR